MSGLFDIAPSLIHGLGAFALQPISCGACVVEYLGAKITKAESARRCEAQNGCIFGLDDQFDLDGAVGWNPARYFNHSCDPNCEAICEDGRIWLLAVRDIGTGEELTFNYGYELESYRDHPCHCGAPSCLRFMVAEEYFAHVRGNTSLGTEGING